MMEFIFNNLTYPRQEVKEKISGIVVIGFVVTYLGEISNPTVVRSIGGGCDEVALEVVHKMPKWIPGKLDGHDVSTRFMLPVRFSLK